MILGSYETAYHGLSLILQYGSQIRGPGLHSVQLGLRVFDGTVLGRQKELVGRPHHWSIAITMEHCNYHWSVP